MDHLNLLSFIVFMNLFTVIFILYSAVPARPQKVKLGDAATHVCACGYSYSDKSFLFHTTESIATGLMWLS